MKRLRDLGGQGGLFSGAPPEDEKGRYVKSSKGLHFVPAGLINLPPDTYMGSACARCGGWANQHMIGGKCESFWDSYMLERFNAGLPLAPVGPNERPWNVRMCFVCARMRDDVVYCTADRQRIDVRGDEVTETRFFNLCGPCRRGKDNIKEVDGRRRDGEFESGNTDRASR